MYLRDPLRHLCPMIVRAKGGIPSNPWVSPKRPNLGITHPRIDKIFIQEFDDSFVREDNCPSSFLPLPQHASSASGPSTEMTWIGFCCACEMSDAASNGTPVDLLRLIEALYQCTFSRFRRDGCCERGFLRDILHFRAKFNLRTNATP